GFTTAFPSTTLSPHRSPKPFTIIDFIFEQNSTHTLTQMDSRKLALLCRELADNKKAEDIVILDVRELSSVTDYFVITSGTSEPHLRAIVDEISSSLKEDHELRPNAVDGTFQAAWIVLDYFDVIVHVMRGDVRERYDLETLWGDA